jgi:hypothetical protein
VQNAVKSESSASSTSDGGTRVHDLTDHIQHIMNESSAVIVNCERSLNFPTSTLRATSVDRRSRTGDGRSVRLPRRTTIAEAAAAAAAAAAAVCS